MVDVNVSRQNVRSGGAGMTSALNLPGIGFRVISNALTPGGGSPLHSGVLKPATADPNRVRSGV